MLPSTDLKASAPRTIAFSVLISPAHPYRYRRFACPLAGTDARLAEKRGSVTPSFQGTCTPYLLPVRLAHRILVLPYRVGSRSRSTRDSRASFLATVTGDRASGGVFRVFSRIVRSRSFAPRCAPRLLVSSSRLERPAPSRYQ